MRNVYTVLMMLCAAPVVAQSVPPSNNVVPNKANGVIATQPSTNLPEIALPTIEDGSAALPEPVENATAVPVPSGAAPAIAAAEAPPKPSYKDFGVSLFYKPAELTRLDAALGVANALANAPQNNTTIEETLAPVAPKVMLTEYPVFFLSSILSQPGNRWAFWLNGDRVTPKKFPDELEVIGVTKDTVRMRWMPMAFPAIASYWATLGGEPKLKAPKNALSKMQMVNVNTDKGYIEFTLKPNQTYSSAFNAVMEGKVAAVAVSGDIDLMKMNDSLFENTLRAQGAKAVRPNDQTTMRNDGPKVVRPGQNSAPRPKRSSGLTQPDSRTIGQVPTIFPGGTPNSSNAVPAKPSSAGTGLPILPPGVRQ